MFFQLTELDPHEVASGYVTPAQVDAATQDALRLLNPVRYCVSNIYTAMQFEYPKKILTTLRSRMHSTVYDEFLSLPQEQGIQWPPNPLHVHWPVASTLVAKPYIHGIQPHDSLGCQWAFRLLAPGRVTGPWRGRGASTS